MKTLEKVYQAPDKTIKIGSRDITPAYQVQIDELEFFKSDMDRVNTAMYLLHKFIQNFEHMNPDMKQYCSPFIGEALKQMACKRDLHAIIWGAGGKVREV